MIIHTLELKNFLSHENSIINFDLGVNLITGKNGAGKSSIIDGIKFALFGDTKRGSVQDLVTRNRQETQVSLGFSVGPDEYRITRIMSVGRSGIKGRDATLLRNGAEIARTVTGVNSAVMDKKLLGINEELFLNSVFVEQGEIASLVSENRSDRERTFSHILGLDLLQQFAQDIQEKGKELKSKLDAMGDAERQLADIRQRIQDTAEEIRGHEAQIRDAESRQVDLDRKLKKADSDLQEARNRVTELKTVAGRVDDLQRKRRDLERELSLKSTEMEKLKHELSGIGGRIDQLLIDNQDSIRQYLDMQTRLDNNRTMLHDVIRQLERISSNETELKKLEPVHTQYGNIQREYQSLEERLKSLEPAIREYEFAFRSLDQAKRKAGHLDEEIRSLQGRLSEFVSADIDEATLASRKASLDAEKSTLNLNIGEIRAQVGQINDQRKKIEGSIQEIRKSSVCPLCRQEITEEHRSRIIADYHNDDSTLVGRIQELSAKKKELEARKAGIENELSALSSRELSQLFTLRSDLAAQESEVRTLEATIRRYIGDNEEYTSLQNKYLQAKQKLQDIRAEEDRYNSLVYAIQNSGRADLEARKATMEADNSRISGDLAAISSRLGFQPDADTGNRLAASLKAQQDAIMTKEKLASIDVEIRSAGAQIASADLEISRSQDILKSRTEAENALSTAQVSYDGARREMDEHMRGVSVIRGKVETLGNSLQRLQVDEKASAERVSRLENIRNALSAVEKVRHCFDRDGIQKTIRKDSAVFITNMMREYSLAFNLNFDDVRVEEDMGIQVSQNGNMESVDMLSGGERTALAIALRLAIVKYVNESVKTMVMDEPTVFLDEDRRQNLTDILQYTFNGEENPIPQMIIVSHHSELRSVSNNVFEVTKQNGISSVQPTE